jgi:arylsulfatase A-like enzyme
VTSKHLLYPLVIWILTLACVSGAKRPNILYIMSDDHALEAVGAYHSLLKDFVLTPTIDRLAAEGMRFTNVCCNNSICSPARATVITGQYSHVNGGYNLNCSLKPDSPSYNIELQKSGYQTAVVGKWHMKHMPRGMDFYAVTKGQGSYSNPTLFRADGSTSKPEGYYADAYVDVALDWLEKRDRGRPFCLNLHFKGPHHPYVYPERLEELHKDTLIPEPASLHEEVRAVSPLLTGKHRGHMLNNRGYFQRHEKDTVPPMWPHEENDHSKISAAYQHMIHKYLRCVAAIDENIKRVIDQLEAEGVLDDTLVIYTSDQGYWLGQHGLYDKRLILEESLKMPFIVRYPKEINAKTVNDQLVSNVDFAPTLLDFAGVKTPAEMQGRSLRPLLRGESSDDWRNAIWYAYWAAGHPHWGVRTKRYKLIRFPDTEAFEFYDLKIDPTEMTNQALNLEYATAIDETESILQSTIAEVGIGPHQMPGKHTRGKAPALETGKKKKK